MSRKSMRLGRKPGIVVGNSWPFPRSLALQWLMSQYAESSTLKFAIANSYQGMNGVQEGGNDDGGGEPTGDAMQTERLQVTLPKMVSYHQFYRDQWIQRSEETPRGPYFGPGTICWSRQWPVSGMIPLGWRCADTRIIGLDGRQPPSHRRLELSTLKRGKRTSVKYCSVTTLQACSRNSYPL